MKPPERCACPECRELDHLPERLQGIPGSWQLKLPIAAKGKRQAKRDDSTAFPPCST